MKKNILPVILVAAILFAATIVSFVATTAQAASDWEQVVAAAKKEGRVVIIGPQGTWTKGALTLEFNKKYPEIQVEFSGMRGSRVLPKMLNEHGARKFLTDIFIGGSTTALTGLLPVGAIVPITPYLSGPNTKDPSKWRGGEMKFSDTARKYTLVMSAYVKAPFVFNPTMVSAGEITSWKDLLDPKWKGKIVIRDPTRPGGGLGTATFWYFNDELGANFIRKLAKNLIVARNDRQILDFVGKGKYPIAIGPSDVLTTEMVGKGIPLQQADPNTIKEGTYITAGAGNISVVKNAPYPNATRVYLDFVLSREGQLSWSKGAGVPSMRKDVSTKHVLNILVPKENNQFPVTSDESFVKRRKQVVGLLK